jgi:hypothetical protein
MNFQPVLNNAQTQPNAFYVRSQFDLGVYKDNNIFYLINVIHGTLFA